MEVLKLSEKSEEFVIIETGGKQYILEKDTVVSIEKLTDQKSKTITFDNVLLHSKNGTLSVGTPYLNIAVKAEILSNETDKKIRVFKFKPKTGYKKKQGHRQTYTTIKVISIGASKSSDSKQTAETKPSKVSAKTQHSDSAKKSKPSVSTKTAASKGKTSSKKT